MSKLWAFVRIVKGGDIMQKKLVYKILISIVITIIAFTTIASFAYSYAVTPDMINGQVEGEEIDLSFTDNIKDFIRIIGTFIAVGALMIIGIKYITGSVEEKANYKKTMIPYIIRMLYTIWSSQYRTNN